jgi:hypothetical protein
MEALHHRQTPIHGDRMEPTSQQILSDSDWADVGDGGLVIEAVLSLTKFGHCHHSKKTQ